MVKNTFSQRFRGATSSAFPQDKINIFLSDQRLLYVVADHLGQAHYISDYTNDDSSSSEELLRSVFSIDEIFRKAYQQSELVICSEHAVLAPGTDDGSITSAFLKGNSSSSLHSDHSTESGYHINYFLPNSLTDYATKMFPNLSLRHLHSILIQIVEQHATNLPGDRIYAHITGSAIALLYLKDGNLQFVNQFDTNSTDDILYYTLLIFNQFGLDHVETPLTISLGNPVQQEVISLLKSYVKNVQVLSFDTTGQPGLIHSNEETFRKYYTPLRAAQLTGVTNQS